MTTDLRSVAPPMVPESHADCIVCGFRNPIGWKLQFQADGESVFIELKLSELLQGYSGIAHGGVIATLLDAAMTHCLFAQSIEAVTADLQIRYSHPVPVNETIVVTARLEKSYQKQLYRMKSELTLRDTVLAHAKARFMPTKSYTTEQE